MAEIEYIERDKYMGVLERYFQAPPVQGRGAIPRGMRMAIGTCIELLAHLNASDVAPVVHAEWEFRNDGRYGQTRCYCSACGKHSGIGGIRENQMKPFCPNCGARMDGGKHG